MGFDAAEAAVVRFDEELAVAMDPRHHQGLLEGDEATLDDTHKPLDEPQSLRGRA